MILLLVALMGIGIPWLPRGGAASGDATEGATGTAPAATAQAVATPESPPSCIERFKKPLREYLHLTDKAEPQERDAIERTLIATVPDPIDAVADYDFDRSIDAIRRAAMALGNQPDRFWLPWSEDCAAARRERDGKAEAETIERCHETTPGRLLFRDAQGKLLEVLLVGETSTWGVHRRALRAALDVVAREQQRGTILIAGPTFSGSARSLREEIDRFNSEDKRGFHVVSGSATAPAVAKILGAESPKACASTTEPPQGCPPLTTDGVCYEATIPDDEQTLSAFLDYLVDEHGVVPSRQQRFEDTDTCFATGVGLLEETGTAYGAGLDPSSAHTWSSHCEREMGPRCRHEKEYKDDYKHHPCQSYVPTTLIRYPAHIAWLRKAHERLAAGDQVPGAHAHVLDRARTPPEEGPTEIVPALSDATPQSTELTLHQALAEVCRQDFRWIGILGTDTLDRLFLAHELRVLCPNVRFFLMGSDVLYTHPSYGQDLDGSVVVSPYPLLPQNREWTAPFDGTISPFAGEGDQGLYNAVIWLLEPPPSVKRRRAVLEQIPPFRDADDTLGTGEQASKPVWITAVGNGDLWPLAILDGRGPYADARSKSAPHIDASRLQVGKDVGWIFDSPNQWIFSVGLASLLAGLACGGYWWGRLGTPGRRLLWGLRWAEVFARPEQPKQPKWGGHSLSRALSGILCIAPAALVYGLVGEAALIEASVQRSDFHDRPKVDFLANVYETCKANPLAGIPMLLLAVLLALAVIDVVTTEIVPVAFSRGKALAVDVVVLLFGLLFLRGSSALGNLPLRRRRFSSPRPRKPSSSASGRGTSAAASPSSRRRRSSRARCGSVAITTSAASRTYRPIRQGSPSRRARRTRTTN